MSPIRSTIDRSLVGATATGGRMPRTARTGAYADPLRSLVVMHLHMDGSNGGTTFLDSSASNLSPSARTATTTTDQSVFGGSSGNFTSGNSLTYAASSLFSFPGDFCIECWCTRPGGGTGRGLFEIGSLSGILVRGNFGDGIYVNGSDIGVSLDALLEQDAPNHFAICRSGTTLRVFTRGRQRHSSTFSGTINSGAAGMKIGTSQYTSGENWNGYIDEFRITKGAARYTANFVPPIAAFPDR